MKRLAGKNAIITGAARGIGAAIAKAFRDEGAEVVLTDIDDIEGEAAAKAIGARYHHLDVSSETAWARLADIASTLDILVNNAGLQVEKTVTDSSDADWDAVMGVNARGVFNCCRAFLPQMTKGGVIINIGSISGSVADPSMALYNASKAFVHGLTRSIAVDHGPRIRCNAICPGWINTGMLEAGFDLAKDPSAARNDAIARHPVGRVGQPEDIAAMAVWLASDEAAFASGQLFTLDGGMTAASPLNPGLF